MECATGRESAWHLEPVRASEPLRYIPALLIISPLVFFVPGRDTKVISHNDKLTCLLARVITGVACEIDIWGAEERARRAKGVKRLSSEHQTPDLSALIDFDLREQSTPSN